jgi:decaprenylphospho-beta-D-ribofuranose 2-oxidase
MARTVSTSLRATAPWRVLDGFGGATRSASRYLEPDTVEELIDFIARARAENLTVTFRGAGRSYGDAVVNRDGLVIDLQRLRRVHHWDPSTGTIDVDPGVTIEMLWRRTLADGYWPAVVPGTMRPTMGGCLAMNVHGKNNYAEGPFGDHVESFELITTSGDRMECSRTENADVFFAAIGGLGLLGAITRVRLALKPVETGMLRVRTMTARSIEEMVERAAESVAASDYTVGWLDALSTGAAVGRGIIHRASYVPASEVPDAVASLDPARQGLPSSIYGVPHRHLWRLLRPMMFNGGVRLINTGRYLAGRQHHGSEYLQSHVAFAFLLDYIPDWRLAYGPSGFIQYQAFVPDTDAPRTLSAILRRCHQAGLPPYLGVLKRHRPDAFLLSHAVDGWSLALDFRIGSRREQLWQLTDALTEIVIAAGGRFYFAKDAVLRPTDVLRAFGKDRIDRFLALKARLDPDELLVSDLWRRVIDRSPLIS